MNCIRKDFCNKKNITLIKTNALEGNNVNQVFELVAKEIINNRLSKKNIKEGRWTKEENKKFIEAFIENGKKWKFGMLNLDDGRK